MGEDDRQRWVPKEGMRVHAGSMALPVGTAAEGVTWKAPEEMLRLAESHLRRV